MTKQRANEMADFSKLISHPEKDRIITKLLSGDTPKIVSDYLSLKYPDSQDSAMRLSIVLLNEFKNKYLDKQKYLDKIIKDEQSGRLDKKIAESIVNNKTWKERIAELADEEIDLRKQVKDVLVLIRARAEQVFDQIQQNPVNNKGDYVLIKYFELLINTIEKADKVINQRPDTLIQQNISIQMVEQHSSVIQQAIQETLLEMDPEISIKFMDKLYAKMQKLQPDDVPQLSIEKRQNIVNKLIPADIEEGIVE